MILMSVFVLVIGCCLKLGDGAVSAKIVTRPPQGPFRLRQTVQFTCEVDSLPIENLTFQWRSVEYTYGGSSYSGQSFNKTFTNRFTLHYVWFFCSVLKNTTQLASSDKIAEIHGLLNTEDSVTRSFSLHQKMLLQINSLSDSYYGYLASYISSLSWYHNGTKILSNERMNVSNTGTSLTILYMVDSDAGKYEVKISSINYYYYYFGYASATCDRNVLRMLEQTALHAPVTFYLQQYHIPQYKPEDIIELYYLPMNSLANSNHTFTINHTTDVNSTFIFGQYNTTYFNQRFFRNGVSQSPNTDNVITERSYGNEINISHHLSYSDTDEIVGNYVYMETAYYYYDSLRFTCRGYYYYVRSYFWHTSVLVHYWSLKIKPIIILQMERLVLTNQSNRIECTVLNSPFPKLSLWHYTELLMETNKTHLENLLPPYQFGQFTCHFTGGSNSSLVTEKDSLQLLIHGGCWIAHEDYYMALVDIMNNLCGECNISLENFNNSNLDYSASEGHTLFTTDILYSNPNGTITSTTLIHRLQTWILSQSSPSLTVAGKVLLIDKHCVIIVNAATKSACINKIASSISPTSINSATTSIEMASIISPIAYVIFALGLLIGAFGATTVAIIVTLCIKKISRSTRGEDLNETERATEGETAAMELAMKSNEAYETVEVHYDEVCYPNRRPQHESNEHIYEQLAF